MSIEGILIGLLAIVIGLAWAFYGLKAFTILLPIWAFFVGLIAGASWGAELFGGGFFGSVTSWIIGLVLGIALALFSYFFYYGAIALLGGTIGYLLGAGLMSAIGITGLLSIVVGIIVGVIFAIGVIVLAVPVMLVIVFSAIGGAAAAVNGVLILLGRIQLDSLDDGALMRGLQTDGLIGIIAFLAVAVAGAFYQIRSVAAGVEGALDRRAAIDQSAYRY